MTTLSLCGRHFNGNGKGFLVQEKREGRSEGNAYQETIVFCIRKIRQVNVEIPPYFFVHSSHFSRVQNPFPFPFKCLSQR